MLYNSNCFKLFKTSYYLQIIQTNFSKLRCFHPVNSCNILNHTLHKWSHSITCFPSQNSLCLLVFYSYHLHIKYPSQSFIIRSITISLHLKKSFQKQYLLGLRKMFTAYSAVIFSNLLATFMIHNLTLGVCIASKVLMIN